MKVVLAGGGTGGHVLPALEIGHALKERAGASLVFLGNKNYIEKRLAAEAGIPFYHIASQGLEGKNRMEKYGGFFWRSSLGVLQACAVLQKIRPDALVATGGFGAAPVMAAARMLGIPYFIHEQNSVAGKVNRLFQGGAAEVFVSMDPTEGIDRGLLTGNPVSYNEPRESEGESLVVLGGSGGSVFLNACAAALAKENPEISVVLQAGEKHREEMESQHIPNLEVIGFAPLKDLYKRARVVIARAGTGTLFELANQGIPSVLVPLPDSADDHQRKNASYFAGGGGMVLIEQKDGEEAIIQEAVALHQDQNRRETMKACLDSHTLRNSSDSIAEGILKTFPRRSSWK